VPHKGVVADAVHEPPDVVRSHDHFAQVHPPVLVHDAPLELGALDAVVRLTPAAVELHPAVALAVDEHVRALVAQVCEERCEVLLLCDFNGHRHRGDAGAGDGRPLLVPRPLVHDAARPHGGLHTGPRAARQTRGAAAVALRGAQEVELALEDDPAADAHAVGLVADDGREGAVVDRVQQRRDELREGGARGPAAGEAVQLVVDAVGGERQREDLVGGQGLRGVEAREVAVEGGESTAGEGCEADGLVLQLAVVI